MTVSSLTVLFNLQHALSSVRENKRFLLLLLFDESGIFCPLVCASKENFLGARQQSHSYASIVRMVACNKMADSRSKQFFVVQIRSGDRTLKDWFGGSLEEETQLVDLFAEFASGKEDIRVFCGIEFVSLSTGKILSSPFVEDSTLQYSAFDNFVSGYTLI